MSINPSGRFSSSLFGSSIQQQNPLFGEAPVIDLSIQNYSSLPSLLSHFLIRLPKFMGFAHEVSFYIPFFFDHFHILLTKQTGPSYIITPTLSYPTIQFSVYSNYLLYRTKNLTC